MILIVKLYSFIYDTSLILWSQHYSCNCKCYLRPLPLKTPVVKVHIAAYTLVFHIHVGGQVFENVLINNVSCWLLAVQPGQHGIVVGIAGQFNCTGLYM